MKDGQKLEKMTMDQLESEIILLRKEQFILRIKKANGILDKIHMVHQIRQKIARIKTFMIKKVSK